MYKKMSPEEILDFSVNTVKILREKDFNVFLEYVDKKKKELLNMPEDKINDESIDKVEESNVGNIDDLINTSIYAKEHINLVAEDFAKKERDEEYKPKVEEQLLESEEKSEIELPILEIKDDEKPNIELPMLEDKEEIIPKHEMPNLYKDAKTVSPGQFE